MFKQLTQSDKSVAMGWIRNQISGMNFTGATADPASASATDSSTDISDDRINAKTSDPTEARELVAASKIPQPPSSTGPDIIQHVPVDPPTLLSYLPLTLSDIKNFHSAAFKNPDPNFDSQKVQESRKDLNTPEPFVIVASPSDPLPHKVPMIEHKADHEDSEVIKILQTAVQDCYQGNAQRVADKLGNEGMCAAIVLLFLHNMAIFV